MSRPAITVDSLSKAYRIGLKEEIPDTLVGVATSWAKAPLRNFHRLRRLNTYSAGDDDQPDLFWALRDVSFDVAEGEVLGVIGRNGAGKSTLLKILSRITEPTSGRAVIRGRVSSLLEVGTGFHPELSGRENIYMNGTILGMRKREIDRKLDEIIDFSGVEQFLDTPIKRYSSGMKVRLAFSVAAHLEPEILIIDEVLAVGDADFQKKCLGKMQDVAQGGRTVLFVSHNMAAVSHLCTRCMTLESGKLFTLGTTEEVIASYLMQFEAEHASTRQLRDKTSGRTGSGEVRCDKVELLSANGERTTAFPMGSDIKVRVWLRARTGRHLCSVAVGIFNRHAARVAVLHSKDTAQRVFQVGSSNFTAVDCSIKSPNLMPGTYRLNLGVQNPDSRQLLDFVEGAMAFNVLPADIYATGIIPYGDAAIYLPVDWSTYDSQHDMNSEYAASSGIAG
ncbi:MAG: ABC transporter ATP-binding protein [Pirellulales bacterium]|nr:ABC transporter ATP-binding protein [Pirellulales bacterium]